jgi:hypothetical protein
MELEDLKKRVEVLNKLIEKEKNYIDRDDKLIIQWKGEQIHLLKMIIRILEDGEPVLQ